MSLPPHRALAGSFLNRYRLAALIQALEDDLRSLIRANVAPFVDADQLIGDKAEELARRAEAEEVYGASPETLVDYLDFGDSFAILNRHRGMLSEQLGRIVRGCTPAFETAVPVRNRVMHGRPLRTDDEDHVARLAQSAIDADCGFRLTAAVAARLAEDPTWTPAVDVSTHGGENVLHNLPLPEFDETGLLGREDELRTVKQFLIQRRFPVTTLAGEGGIGKTALAVQALYDLVDSPDCPYSVVLWTSLKTERLTGRGVEQIREAAFDVVSIASDLASAIDNSAHTDLELLAEVLEGTEVLIAIDNVESIGADEIRALIDGVPNATFLLTSRVGLGEIERRVALGALVPKAAKAMLRQLASRRGLAQLARLSETQVSQVTERLRRSPLAIRWFVEAVQAGGQPDDLLRDQTAVLQFCMATIYDSLAPEARKLVDCLLALDGPATLGELALLVDMDRSDAQEQIYELQRRAIVHVDGRLTENLSQTYSLADMAREYLERFGALDETFAEGMRRRVREIAASQEAGHGEGATLEPGTVIAVSPEERAVANVLRQALQRSRNGDLERARSLVARARNAVPGYFESYRVGALIESHVRPEEARRLYLEAYRLAPVESRGVVAYWLAEHLAMNLLSASEAEPYAREAHDAFGMPRSALRLGQVLMYLGRFDESKPLLEAAATDGTGRVKAIAETSLLDLARRGVRQAASDLQPVNALAVANTALARGWDCATKGIVDRRLFEAIGELVSDGVAVALRVDDISLLDEPMNRLLSSIDEHFVSLSRPSVLPLWEGRMRRLAERADLSLELQPAIDRVVAHLDARSEEDDSDKATGEVIEFSSKKHYGFIRPDDRGENLFFHVSEVADPQDRLLLVRGREVSYIAGEEERDGERRPRGTSVRVLVSEQAREESLRSRRGIVVRVDPTYAFLEDIPTQERIYVGSDALRDPRAWTRINVGEVFSYDAQFNAQGVYAALGSVAAAPSEAP